MFLSKCCQKTPQKIPCAHDYRFLCYSPSDYYPDASLIIFLSHCLLSPRFTQHAMLHIDIITCAQHEDSGRQKP